MASLREQDLAHFTGGLVRFRHAINRRVIYTEGVKHVAEEGGAYWLIDEIALYLGSDIFERMKLDYPLIGAMHFWRLRVNAASVGELTAREDSDKVPFLAKLIPYTDFPIKEIEVWAAYSGEHWTLYLPSEH